MTRHEQIDAVAKAIWQRESPAKIYAALDGLFPDRQGTDEHILDERDAAIQDRDVAVERAEKAEMARDTLLAALEKVREEPWNRHQIIRDAAEKGRPHINASGEFQSDKYPTCPPGKVPLSVKDKTAQDLLWSYAQRRREVDAEFADDLETCLKAAGYLHGKFSPTDLETQLEVAAVRVDVGGKRDSDFQPTWVKYPRLRAAFQENADLLIEFIPLLREARADAVQFIKDASAEELQKARQEGMNALRPSARIEVSDVAKDGTGPFRLMVNGFGVCKWPPTAVEDEGWKEYAEETARVLQKALGQSPVEHTVRRLQIKCDDLQREIDADTGIIRSHIELRTNAETERDHLKLIVACAWRAYHGGFIEDAVKDLYSTLVRYAPDGDLPAPNGEWVHCSPELLAEGVDCGSTKRRDCLDRPPGSHDHWVVREPINATKDAVDNNSSSIRIGSRVRITGNSFSTEKIWMKFGTVDSLWPLSDSANVKVDGESSLHGIRMYNLTLATEESDEPVRPQQSFRITIRNTAGHIQEDGSRSPIVASRGRVFYVHDETIAGATAKFCNAGIPATDRLPATPVLLTDFDIVPSDESDIPEKAIENWTGARPG